MDIAVEYAHAIIKYSKFVHQVVEKINAGNSQLKNIALSEWKWSFVWAVCVSNLYKDDINISFDDYYAITLKELNKSLDDRLEDYKKRIVAIKLCVSKQGGSWFSQELSCAVPKEICDVVMVNINELYVNDQKILSYSPAALKRLFLKQYELYRTDLGNMLTILFDKG